MVLFNHTYKNYEQLEAFIVNNIIGDNVLIQVFASKCSKENLALIKDQLKSLLPKSALIVTTTAGIVNSGEIIDDEVVISFSSFEASIVKDVAYCQKSINEILEDLTVKYITNSTKLIIAFANTFRCDSALLLDEMSKSYPNIVIVGGNAGDDFQFKECTVMASEHSDCDIAFAIIDSEVLSAQTEYFFNWETVGRSMIVTKSIGSTVYEIDHRPIVDIYEHYLGKIVRDNLTEYGIEYPLVFEDNDTVIARALVAFDEETGSITFAGNIPQGKEVKFGYANINHIKNLNHQYLHTHYDKKFEAVYIYTCGARRQMIGNFLHKELQTLNALGNSVGFITYGEFFHNRGSCSNNLLNITTTFITLNEKVHTETIDFQDTIENKISKEDVRVSALTTLLKQTSQELDENILYLEQFKKAIDEVAIFSRTNEKGIITDVNENFETVSGYTRAELIGKPHSIVRHPDTPKELFADMWNTIQSGKIWKGTVKNRKKNGKSYYVLTEISPIYNKDGSFKEYIGVRNDITELEEYKEILKTELTSTKKSLDDKLYYIKQYEDAVNSTIAVLKTDLSSNNKCNFF